MRDSYHKYFALSEEDRMWELYILNCGTNFIAAGNHLANKDHPSKYLFNWDKGRILHEFQLVYILNGEGIFENESAGQIHLKQGMLFALFPDVWHRYKADLNHDWKTNWIGFHGEMAARTLKKMDITEDNPVRMIGHHTIIIDIFNELLRNSEAEFSGYQQVLAGDLMSLLGWIHAIGKKSAFNEEHIDVIMHDAKRMLTEPDKFKDMASIARALGIGYSKFRKLFKHYTGISLGQYRLQHQLRKASDALVDSHSSIQEICDEFGFQSVQYFSRIFKQKYGRTPGSFRRGV